MGVMVVGGAIQAVCSFFKEETAVVDFMSGMRNCQEIQLKKEVIENGALEIVAFNRSMRFMGIRVRIENE